MITLYILVSKKHTFVQPIILCRLKTKKNRESLEEFLLGCDRVTSLTKFYKCEEMFSNLEASKLHLDDRTRKQLIVYYFFTFSQIWRCVPESDRRDIFEDCIFAITKREKEEAKTLKKRNMKMLAQVSSKIGLKSKPHFNKARLRHRNEI